MYVDMWCDLTFVFEYEDENDTAQHVQKRVGGLQRRQRVNLTHTK